MRYFDHNATTSIAPEVLEAMMPFLTDRWGNASSSYRFGHAVAEHIEQARADVARLLNAAPEEIVFTGCGTESNNTALHSAISTQPQRRHLVVSAVEHPATLKYARHLERQGYEVSVVPVDREGRLDLVFLERSLRPDTALVSIMWANNETGMLFPIETIAQQCRERGILVHTDAVQAAGKVSLDVRAAPVDFLSLSAHKLHAPKGVGVLYVRGGTRLQPLLIGGGQEHGARAGTENVPYLVGFGAAARRAQARLAEYGIRVRAMRDRLESCILRSIAKTHRNGAEEPRLPNTSNLSFVGIEGEGLLHRLDEAGICVSTGSACTAGHPEPSPVLMAMGLSPARARGAVRFSLGLDNTGEDVEALLALLPQLVHELRRAQS